MKVLYFDCSSGISGNTALGALLDMGIEADELDKMMSGIGLACRYDLTVERKNSNGILGTEVKIGLETENSRCDRSMKDILRLIGTSELPPRVRDISSRAVKEFMLSEARAQNVPVECLEDFCLKEPVSVQNLLSIVGCAACVEMLGIEKVYSSHFCVGKSFTGREGIALIKTLSDYFGNMPAIIIEKIGYGLSINSEDCCNVLKVVMGELFGESDAMEEFAVIGENISYIMNANAGRIGKCHHL